MFRAEMIYCWWGSLYVNILWWHNQIAGHCTSRPPPSFSRFKEFNSDNFPFLRSLAAMSGSWDDLLPVYFRMRLARWRSSSAVAYCFWLLKREQSYWSKRAASFTLNNRISSMSEVLFRRSNFAHKLILKTYLSRMYPAFFRQFRLLHFQKQTHKLLRIFEILPPSGPLWEGG